MNKEQSNVGESEARPRLNEDWLAVILAFLIILLSALGVLGKNGLMIPY